MSRRSRLVRPRTIIYAFLITGITLAFLTALALRTQLDVNVLHDRNPLFVTLSDGSIRNGYTIHVLNMGQEERQMTLTVDGLPGAEITVVGAEQDDAVSANLDVTSDAVLTYRVFVSVPAEVLEENATDIAFVFDDPDAGLVSSHDSVFRGP